MGNIYQSDPWAVVQRNLGRQVFQGRGEGWHYLAILECSRTGRYLYCPSGPEAVSPQTFDAALAALKSIALEQECSVVRIAPITTAMCQDPETPESALRRRGLCPSPRQMRPMHTQVINLAREEDAILRDMSSRNRAIHRNIHKKGVTFTTSSDPADINLLLPILDAVAYRNGFDRMSDEYFRAAAHHLMPLGAATLHIAWLHETPLEVTLVFDWEGTRVQAHGGMDYAHRALNAGNAQTVRMILDAKAKGLKQFDLWGIAPKNAGPEHEWYGFTKFKKSFGGHPESYPGTWDLPVNPLKYSILRTEHIARDKASKVRAKLRRLARAHR